jgi:type I restriction enzyme, S subunit
MTDTPRIRFNGYTDAWEQRKLGEIANKVTKKNTDLAVDETFTNSAEHGIISQKDFFDHDIVNASNIGGYYVVEPNDFVYNPRISNLAPVGPINRNKMVKNGVMSPLYTVFKPHDVDYTYLEQFFKSKVWHPFMYYNGDSGARSDRFSIKDELFFQMPIFLPSIKEQRKIGAYLDSLDNAITLHQRKSDEFRELKKYMLQKMFPKPNCDRPEIRFAGFTDAWEQRKLGDVFSEYSEKNHPELPALTIIQGGGTVRRDETDRNLIYDKANLSNYKKVKENDFIVHLRSFEGGLEKATCTGLISPAYHTFHSDIADSRFYYPYFRSHEFVKRKLLPHVYGIRDGRSIDIEGMKSILIPYTSLEEQRKIGAYLDSLDKAITLHQRKSDEFRELKKYMLQQMLPKK